MNFRAPILETNLFLEFGGPKRPCMTLPVIGQKQVEAAAGDVVKKAVADMGICYSDDDDDENEDEDRWGPIMTWLWW